jgi:hypothetical protein
MRNLLRALPPHPVELRGWLEEMMRKLIGKCALALVLPSVAAALLVGGAAPAALATTPTPVIHFDGTPGTSAPPSTLGPYTMFPFASDSRPVSDEVSDVTLPDGTMTFSPTVHHVRVGDGWGTWSNGYTGDVYYDLGTTLTMTLPAGTGAFYFYLEPVSFGTFTFEAVAQDGTTSGPVSVAGNSGAKYFGFYGTGGAAIKTIEVTNTGASSEGFAVGEFAVGSAALQLADLHQAVQGVGTGTVLSTIVGLAQQQLAAGHPQTVCTTMTAFIIEVEQQKALGQIPAALAAELLADASNIQTILC